MSANTFAGLLDVIEGLKQQADALQAELGEAGKAAEVAARRSRRLAERSRQLQVSSALQPINHSN
jgi:hypothetical protein